MQTYHLTPLNSDQKDFHQLLSEINLIGEPIIRTKLIEMANKLTLK